MEGDGWAMGYLVEEQIWRSTIDRARTATRFGVDRYMPTLEDMLDRSEFLNIESAIDSTREVVNDLYRVEWKHRVSQT